jgi:predicted nucleic acid-binding protein
MILVDTSIWINHLRRGDPVLIRLLNEDQVLIHPFVVGELACGSLKSRNQILNLLKSLPQATVATDPKTLDFIGTHAIMGRGVGYVDAHLCASAQLSNAKLWTRDKRLYAVVTEKGWAYSEAAH